MAAATGLIVRTTTVRRMAVGVVVTMAAATAAAPPAQAERYLSRSEAQSNAIHFGYKRYRIDRERLISKCRPIGRRYERGRQYPRWICTWGLHDRCWGSVFISGNRRGPGWYSHREQHRYRCGRS